MNGTRRGLRLPALAVLASVVTACPVDEYEPPGEEQRIELADSLYSPALFDTIDWPSDGERIDAGNLVFASHCRLCHGPVGEGGHVVIGSREIVVPSLVELDWRLEEDIEGVRGRVFTGHRGGMPTWGLTRLTPREIDAVAFYLLTQLRPEMLGP